MESQYSAIQRGFDNVIANWPLLLIRLAENAALAFVIIAAVFGAILPIAFFGAFAEELRDFQTPQELLDAMLGTPLLMILYVFLILSLVLTMALAIHSFVQGGVVGCYLEGERKAKMAGPGERSRFKVFTPDLWIRYGRRDWWPLFLIYNATWGLFGLILLLPLIALLVLIFSVRDTDAVIPLTCGGLVVVFLLMFLGAIVVHLWSTCAIVLRSTGRQVGAALSEGWRVTVRRIVPLIVLAIIALAVSFAAAGSIGVGGFGLGVISSVPGMALLTIPVQIGISFLQTAVSIAVYSWFLAAVISLILS